MINYGKLILFVINTLLFLATLIANVNNKIWVAILYVLFVLVGLHDLGKDEVEEEKSLPVENKKKQIRQTNQLDDRGVIIFQFQ